MTTDALRERWARGEPAINAWMLGSDPAVSASLASTGFDGVTVDLQHGRATEAILEGFAAGAEGAGAVPLARLRWSDPPEIMRVLDLGVRGVICPMVGSGDEAARFATATRYPPRGVRSYGPIAGAFGTGGEHVAAANDRVLAFAMIETAEGLAHVDDIAATPGIDGLYVGPADLSLSLGLSTFADLGDARLLEALDATLAAAGRHGIVAGVHAPTPETSAEMVGRGFRFVTPFVHDGRATDAAGVLERTRSSIGGG